MTGSSSTDTVTPEPSISGASPLSQHASLSPLQEETDDDYEAQIQRAIRLSLLEGVNDAGQSPRGISSGEYEFQVKTKTKKGKSKASASASPSVAPFRSPAVPRGEPSNDPGSAALSSSPGVNYEDDLELALRLSLEDEEMRQRQREIEDHHIPFLGLGIPAIADQQEDFPALEVKGKGKGRLM